MAGEVKHTPGPWQARAYGSLHTGVELFGDCDSDDEAYLGELDMLDGSPDARLIAAAPEMYELLQQLVRIVADDAYPGLEVELDSLARARALLARIEGEG